MHSSGELEGISTSASVHARIHAIRKTSTPNCCLLHPEFTRIRKFHYEDSHFVHGNGYVFGWKNRMYSGAHYFWSMLVLH